MKSIIHSFEPRSLFSRDMALSPWNQTSFWKASDWPQVDLQETDTDVQVTISVQGFQQEELDLNYQNGALHLSAKQVQTQRDESQGFTRETQSQRQFSRMIPISQNVDWEQVQARLEHGELKVCLPKTDEAKQIIKLES